MVNTIAEFILSDVNPPRMIILGVCLLIFMISTTALLINVIEWSTSIYIFAKRGWLQFTYPDLTDRVSKIKYSLFIICHNTGEIYYIDKKRLKKLKRHNLIEWDDELCKYIFDDKDTDKIRNLIQPFIQYDFQ